MRRIKVMISGFDEQAVEVVIPVAATLNVRTPAVCRELGLLIGEALTDLIAKPRDPGKGGG